MVSFAEAYNLRGLFNQMSKYKETQYKSYKLSIKGIEQIYVVENETLNLHFNEEINNFYFQEKEGFIPFHTCLFANKTFSKHFKNLLSDIKTIGKDEIYRFLNEDIGIDEIKNMENELNNLADNYDSQ